MVEGEEKAGSAVPVEGDRERLAALLYETEYRGNDGTWPNASTSDRDRAMRWADALLRSGVSVTGSGLDVAIAQIESFAEPKGTEEPTYLRGKQHGIALAVACLRAALTPTGDTPKEPVSLTGSGPRDHESRESLIHRIELLTADLAASEARSLTENGLREAAERLYLTVRLMRTFVGHDHTEPWPCPVFLVDEAQRALAALIDDGTERLPYPPDLNAIYQQRMTAHVAALSGESGEPKETERS